MSDEDRLQEQYGGKELTKKEFIQLPAMKTCKGNITGCGIAFYILGAINLALELYMHVLPLDGLGVHLGKSRICALLSAAYSIFGLVYSVATTGQRTGYLIVIVAIDAVIYTFKYQSAWSKYKKDGTLPVEKERK